MRLYLPAYRAHYWHLNMINYQIQCWTERNIWKDIDKFYSSLCFSKFSWHNRCNNPQKYDGKNNNDKNNNNIMDNNHAT